MTATERIFSGDVDVYLSMDDPRDYGEVFYQLSFKDCKEIIALIIGGDSNHYNFSNQALSIFLDKVENLNKAAMKLGEMMYKESQEQNANANAEKDSKKSDKKSGKGSKNDEDVVDADFEEVKSDEKNEKSAEK